MEILSQPSRVRARKVHSCSWCRGDIQPKETYCKVVYKYEGVIFDWKSHIKCMDAMPDSDIKSDGTITADSFHYFISEVVE